MIRFLRERVWAHLPAKAPLKQRLWASLLWGFVLPLVIAGVRWALHPSGGFQAGPARTVMMVTVPLALLLPIPVLGPWIYLTVLRVFSVVGFFVSHAFLVLIFYVIITPIGWALKLAGRDPLGVRHTAQPPQWWPTTASDERNRYYRMF